MRNTWRSIALILLASCTAAIAQSRPFGLGVIAGEPMGGTFKIWFNPYITLDFAAGADFGPPSTRPFYYTAPPAFQLHADFLGHVPLVRGRNVRIPVYFGAGPKFTWRNRGFESVRARTPVGVSILMPRPPFPAELFFEFAPTWGRNPRPLDSDACMGFRYYF
jgi:hypothetical protein